MLTHCPFCKAAHPTMVRAKFCGKCGRKQPQNPSEVGVTPASESRSPRTAPTRPLRSGRRARPEAKTTKFSREEVQRIARADARERATNEARKTPAPSRQHVPDPAGEAEPTTGKFNSGSAEADDDDIPTGQHRVRRSTVVMQREDVNAAADKSPNAPSTDSGDGPSAPMPSSPGHVPPAGFAAFRSAASAATPRSSVPLDLGSDETAVLLQFSDERSLEELSSATGLPSQRVHQIVRKLHRMGVLSEGGSASPNDYDSATLETPPDSQPKASEFLAASAFLAQARAKEPAANKTKEEEPFELRPRRRPTLNDLEVDLDDLTPLDDHDFAAGHDDIETTTVDDVPLDGGLSDATVVDELSVEHQLSGSRSDIVRKTREEIAGQKDLHHEAIDAAIQDTDEDFDPDDIPLAATVDKPRNRPVSAQPSAPLSIPIAAGPEAQPPSRLESEDGSASKADSSRDEAVVTDVVSSSTESEEPDAVAPEAASKTTTKASEADARRSEANDNNPNDQARNPDKENDGDDSSAKSDDGNDDELVELSEQAQLSYRKLYETKFHPLPVEKRAEFASKSVGAELIALCFDQSPSVIKTLLDNTATSLPHARLISIHHQTGIGLDALAMRAQFARDPLVQRRLLRNAMLPEGVLRKIVMAKRLVEVYKLTNDRDLPDRARTSCRVLLRRRFTTAQPEERVELIWTTEGRCLTQLSGTTLDSKTTAMLCARNFVSVMMIQSFARFPATPPALISHMLKQPMVKRQVHLKNMLLKHPNTPGEAKRRF